MFTPGPGWALVGPRQRPENLPASAVRAVTANDRTPGAVAWLAAAAYRASQRSRRDRLRRCPWPSGTAGKSASLADAAAIAARAAGMGQVVVAVGGDGLAGALSGVAAAGGARYGIIPAGTGNDLARVLGIPAGPAAAARVLTAGQERRVDLIGVATPGQPETVVAGSVYVGIPSVAGEIANRTGWAGADQPGPRHRGDGDRRPGPPRRGRRRDPALRSATAAGHAPAHPRPPRRPSRARA